MASPLMNHFLIVERSLLFFFGGEFFFPAPGVDNGLFFLGEEGGCNEGEGRGGVLHCLLISRKACIILVMHSSRAAVIETGILFCIWKNSPLFRITIS